jgi:hypothetical protein
MYMYYGLVLSETLASLYMTQRSFNKMRPDLIKNISNCSSVTNIIRNFLLIENLQEHVLCHFYVVTV